MRLFLFTYYGNKNFVTTKHYETFGAKKDGTGLSTKISKLRRGDLIVYRDGSEKSCCSLFGASFVSGKVFDQEKDSPFKSEFWPDEENFGKPIYSLRVPVDFETAPIINDIIDWQKLFALRFYNKKGFVMMNKQMWGGFFRGNFIESPDKILKFSNLLGISGIIN